MRKPNCSWRVDEAYVRVAGRSSNPTLTAKLSVSRMPGVVTCRSNAGMNLDEVVREIPASDTRSVHSKPEQNQFIEARSALADCCFRWSTNTPLQTSTHSLQIYTRLERSDGFEMKVSTWSCVLLQNEHLRISSSSLRWPNMIPVWRESDGSQDARKFKRPAHRAKALRRGRRSKDAAFFIQKIACFGYSRFTVE